MESAVFPTNKYGMLGVTLFIGTPGISDVKEVHINCLRTTITTKEIRSRLTEPKQRY